MKKITLTFFLFALIAAMPLSAQKKAVKKTAGTSVKSLNNEIDSLSYAMGAAITQGLEDHLKQIGVLSATDSIANKKNLNLFMDGFKEYFAQAATKEAYYKGIGVAGQVSQTIENFDKLIGEEGVKVNNAAFLSGFEASLKKESLLLSGANELIQNKAMQAQQKEQAKQDADLKAKYADNIAEGEKFLNENKTKSGVVTLPDGLQYKVLQEGNGPKPTSADKVKVHYHGTLIDGTVFDSSIDRGEPITFGITQVIPGWTEALKLMPQGSKWTVYIPAELAYGARDMGKIKPYSTLIFDIELLEVIGAESGN